MSIPLATTTKSPTDAEKSVPSVDKSGPRVRRMFASIAGRYDLLNHLLSLNIDKTWRNFTVRKVPPQPGLPVLDCCTGTADLALAYDRSAQGQSPVVGSDFCRPMLQHGWRKVKKAGVEGRVRLIEADTQNLPWADDTFGVVTVAFGLRNVSDTGRGLDEMVRVTSPGGQVAVLEFSKPTNPVLGSVYKTFFRHVLPRVGQAIAPNDDNAYNYLPNSVLQFPEGQTLLNLMGKHGLIDLRLYPLTFGIATLYVGRKPYP